ALTETQLKNQMAYLQWYLIKSSFDNGKNFGKGIFVIQMKNEEYTKKLYNYLRNDRASIYSELTINDSNQRTKESLQKTYEGFRSAKTHDSNPTYSTTSSHFNGFMERPTAG